MFFLHIRHLINVSFHPTSPTSQSHPTNFCFAFISTPCIRSTSFSLTSISQSSAWRERPRSRRAPIRVPWLLRKQAAAGIVNKRIENMNNYGRMSKWNMYSTSFIFQNFGIMNYEDLWFIILKKNEIWGVCSEPSRVVSATLEQSATKSVFTN